MGKNLRQLNRDQEFSLKITYNLINWKYRKVQYKNVVEKTQISGLKLYEMTPSWLYQGPLGHRFISLYQMTPLAKLMSKPCTKWNRNKY